MNHFKQLADSLSPAERKSAAINAFDFIEGLTDSQRRDVMLGIASASKLYSVDLSSLAEINRIDNLQAYIGAADNLDQNEKFDASLKSFFTINYLPSTQRDMVFTGLYASSILSGINIDNVASDRIPDIQVGKVNPVW